MMSVLCVCMTLPAGVPGDMCIVCVHHKITYNNVFFAA